MEENNLKHWTNMALEDLAYAVVHSENWEEIRYCNEKYEELVKREREEKWIRK